MAFGVGGVQLIKSWLEPFDVRNIAAKIVKVGSDK